MGKVIQGPWAPWKIPPSRALTWTDAEYWERLVELARKEVRKQLKKVLRG